MQTIRVVLGLVLGLMWGCEEADSIDPPPPIMPSPDISAHVEPGTRTFTAETTGDSVGRARFCDEMERTKQTIGLIRKDIVPDDSVGGIDLWDDEGNPISVDSLVGRPEDGKLCDPTAEYDDAFAWGTPNPYYPIAVIFNPETRLIDSIQISSSYQGVMKGEVERADGESFSVLLSTRERVVVTEAGGAERELDEYAASVEQARRPNSWLNHENVNLMYGMIRQTYFDEAPAEPGYDCIADQRCDIIYTTPDESTPQQTNVVFQDSGVTLIFSPTGHLQFLIIRPVRKAEFELAGSVALGTEEGEVNLTYRSTSVDGCDIDLAAGLSFAQFRDRCVVGNSRDRQLARADYITESQRDAVEVAFEGVNLNFLRDTSKNGVVGDGERPRKDDQLYMVTYTRSLLAPTAEFVASELALAYQLRLRARLAASLSEGAGPEHPFQAFDVTIPEGLLSEPQRIGELEFPVPGVGMVSFVPTAIAEVRAAYEAMSDEEQAVVAPRALSDVALVEPFVDAVMAALSHGKSDAEGAYKLFQTVENERWSIGRTSFMQDGQPYRMMVQYSLYFGAITAVTIAKGFSEADEVLNAVVEQAQQVVEGWTSPYYDLRLALPGLSPTADPSWNPYCLGCNPGIEVSEVNRLNNTLTVMLPVPGSGKPVQMTVPGYHIEDRSGYMRQLRGERFEFVPAHRINIYGKEANVTVYLTEDGSIGRLDQGTFKGAPLLCAGLRVRYGDDVRALIEAWQSSVDDGTYQACDLVFNYSPDGTVLNGVTSLSNRISFFTTAGRAVSLGMWQ